jgi:hypothetical protein
LTGHGRGFSLFLFDLIRELKWLSRLAVNRLDHLVDNLALCLLVIHYVHRLHGLVKLPSTIAHAPNLMRKPRNLCTLAPVSDRELGVAIKVSTAR